MDWSNRLVNIVMIAIVSLFLVVGLGGLAIYRALVHDRPEVSDTATSTPTRFAAMPSLSPAAQCKNDAALVSAATEPNLPEFQPRQEFNRLWRIQNTGSCPWNNNYRLALVDGARMGAPAEIAMPNTAPGATAQLSVKMTAPANTGSAAAVWQVTTPGGERFGPPFDATIRVSKPGTRVCNGSPVITSFRANPATIAAGQSARLSWGLVDNADTAEIDNGIGGVGTPDERSVSPAATTTYTLTARCGPNVTQAQVTVVVR